MQNGLSACPDIITAGGTAFFSPLSIENLENSLLACSFRSLLLYSKGIKRCVHQFLCVGSCTIDFGARLKTFVINFGVCCFLLHPQKMVLAEVTTMCLLSPHHIPLQHYFFFNFTNNKHWAKVGWKVLGRLSVTALLSLVKSRTS